MTERPEEDRTAPATRRSGDVQKPDNAGTPAPPTSGTDEFELDLEVGDIQTRLPYGSEDIADK